MNQGTQREGDTGDGSDYSSEITAHPEPKKGHPRGLWVLFITEMWERFSYYGMRALLTLYLIASTSEVLMSGEANANPGFGWPDKDAYALYGVYCSMVYFTAIFGGVLADRFLGTHRSMIIGGWIIAAGHICLACTDFFGITPGKIVTLQTSPGALLCFLIGLALIVIGTGFFKPCVSVMVGQLYERGDPRRDSGFTIFYMGINLGAFFSPLVAGTLGQTIGWHWGFGSAAVGMLAGLFVYQTFRPRYLSNIGLPPADRNWSGRSLALFLATTGGLIAVPVVPLILWLSGSLSPLLELWGWLTATTVRQIILGMAATFALVGVILAFVLAQRRHERGPLVVIFVLAFLGNIIFWTAFEQAGSSMNVFADRQTNRPLPLPEWFRNFCQSSDYGPWYVALVIGIVLLVPFLLRYGMKMMRARWATAATWLMAALGVAALSLGVWKLVDMDSLRRSLGDANQFPSTWYQSVNPLAILLFAPVFAWLWVWLDRRGLNPSTPMKFSWGLFLLGFAFIGMVLGAMEARNGQLAGPHWLLITYVVYTWGELCLSPVGLSMVTKLAPDRLQSLMMGFWFFTFSLANLLAGLVARFSTRVETGEVTFVYEGLPGFFLMLVVFPLAAGVVICLLTPLLKRMMHGVE